MTAEHTQFPERPPTQIEIAARLRRLADDMDAIAVILDYYGGFAAWSEHGREIAGAGGIARQWAAQIEDAGAIDAFLDAEVSAGTPHAANVR